MDSTLSAQSSSPSTVTMGTEVQRGEGEEALEVDGEELQATELFPKMAKLVYVFFTTTTKNVNVATDEINRFFI